MRLPFGPAQSITSITATDAAGGTSALDSGGYTLSVDGSMVMFATTPSAEKVAIRYSASIAADAYAIYRLLHALPEGIAMSDAFLASRLRERVTIESPERNADTYGGGDATWIVFATVYASVKPLMCAASDVLTADQVSAIAGYRVSLRKRDDVDASMRILWNGRRLMIHSLHETEQTLAILTYEETL